MTRRTLPDAGTQGPLLFRLLLQLFPGDFRTRFGAEILETYTEHWLATAHSPRARIAFVLRSIVDATASAALEHLSSARATRRDRRSPSLQNTMTSLSRDLSFALRSLARRPGLVATIVLTLALGIGANTAVFSLTDAVLLRPLSIPEPERVVRVMKARSETSRFGNFAYPHYRALAEDTESFSQLAVSVTTELAVESGDRHEQLTAGLVTGNYFNMLGLTPTVGAFFREEDTRVPGAGPHVVLSHEYWNSHFGADPETVGRTVRIAGNPFTVIGVAPRDFRGLELVTAPAIWVPLSMHESIASPVYSNAEALETPYLEFFHVTGRLRPNVTFGRAEAELNALFARISDAEAASGPAFTPPALESPIWLIPAVESAAMTDRESLLRFVRLLAGTAILTLLLACVNVANLLLVRGSERTAELGVRVALGASRVRVVRQLLVESLLLALGGAVAGVLVGAAVVRLISSFTLPGGIELTHLSLGLDVRVLAFTSGLAILTSLIFGILPAISASRVDPSTALRSSTGRSSARAPHSTLLGVQVAISLVLLTGAALFLRSLQAGLTTDIGFDPAPLVAVSMEPRLTGATGEQVHQMYRDAVESVARIPGVTSVAVGTHVPLASTMTLPFRAASGAGATPPAISAGLASVMPGYFETLGVPLSAGRDFTVDDDERVGRVAILNVSGARTFFGDMSPLGRELELFTMKYTVVGVVHDTKYGSVRDDAFPFVYVSLAQERNVGGVSIVARSATPSATLPLMRTALRDVGALTPVRDARLVARQVDAVLMPQRFGATLLTLFGLVALMITAVGIYGTVSLTVNQRTTEIGIRSALGAGNGHIVRLVLWRTGIAMLIGCLVGGAAALLGSRAAEHFLYGIARTDMLAFGAAAGVLVATVLIVALGPARRAARIDPALAMRSE